MYRFPFEKLDVWGLARGLCVEIYRITRFFPDYERFGLAAQMNRAAVSVASNLAEGSSRVSKKDQAHFSQIAFSSLMELMCQVLIAKDLDYLAEEKYTDLRIKIELISNKINALRNYQTKTLSK